MLKDVFAQTGCSASVDSAPDIFELVYAEWQATDCAACEAWRSIWRKTRESSDALRTLPTDAEIADAIELTHQATELLREVQSELRARRERVLVI